MRVLLCALPAYMAADRLGLDPRRSNFGVRVYCRACPVHDSRCHGSRGSGRSTLTRGPVAGYRRVSAGSVVSDR